MNSTENVPASVIKESDGSVGRKRYRIAMVCDFFHPRLGGVENHIWSLSQQLVRLGHSVVVITHAYDGYRDVHYYEGPIKCYYCPILPMTQQSSLPSFTATLPLLRWILLREQIDIVHGHQATSSMANEAIVYASAMNIPAVYTDHSLFAFDELAGIILSRVQQTTLCTLQAAIAVSHACRDNLILRTRMDATKVHVIPNAVDTTKFVPPSADELSQRALQPNFLGRIKVVVVSRLVYRKGVDLLVGIIPLICRARPNVDFIVGGDGDKLPLLQEMAQREGLLANSRVQFLGAVPHHQVRDAALIQGHIFLNCSLTESFCIAILEAASTGLLVVSTNVGGIPEVLPPDLIFLADPNVPAMVAELLRTIECYETTPHDPWQTHNRIRTLYSWDRVARETEQVYATAVQRFPVYGTDFRGRAARMVARIEQYYRGLNGGISGWGAALLAITLQVWLTIVEMWQPESRIDRVPNLVFLEAMTEKSS